MASLVGEILGSGSVGIVGEAPPGALNDFWRRSGGPPTEAVRLPAVEVAAKLLEEEADVSQGQSQAHSVAQARTEEMRREAEAERAEELAEAEARSREALRREVARQAALRSEEALFEQRRRAEAHAKTISGLDWIPSGKVMMSNKFAEWVQDDVMPRMFRMINNSTINYTSKVKGGYLWELRNIKLYWDVQKYIVDFLPKKGIHVGLKGVRFRMTADYSMTGEGWYTQAFASAGLLDATPLDRDSSIDIVLMPEAQDASGNSITIRLKEFSIRLDNGPVEFTGSWWSFFANWFYETSVGSGQGDETGILRDGFSRMATDYFTPLVENLAFNLTVSMEHPYDILVVMFAPCCFRVHDDRVEMGIRGDAVAPKYHQYVYPFKPPAIPMEFLYPHKHLAITLSPWIFNTGIYIFWKLGYFNGVISNENLKKIDPTGISEKIERWDLIKPLNKYTFCIIIPEWCIPPPDQLVGRTKELIKRIKNGQVSDAFPPVYIFVKTPESPKIFFKQDLIAIQLYQHIEFTFDSSGTAEYEFMLKVPVLAYITVTTDNSGPFPKVVLQVKDVQWEVQMADIAKVKLNAFLVRTVKFLNRFIGFLEENIILPAINVVLKEGVVVEDQKGMGLRNLHLTVSNYLAVHFDVYWEVEDTLRTSPLANYLDFHPADPGTVGFSAPLEPGSVTAPPTELPPTAAPTPAPPASLEEGEVLIESEKDDEKVFSQ